jgi:hypothetical protein
MSSPSPKAAAAWSLPRLQCADITYTTTDRFGDLQDSDPDNQYAQMIEGEIAGVLFDDYQTTIPLGTLALARINLDDGSAQTSTASSSF